MKLLNSLALSLKLGLLLTLFVACDNGKIETVVKQVGATPPPSIAGIYYLSNYSILELQSSNDVNEYYVYTSNQSIKSVNKDQTLAIHPTISGTRLVLVGNELRWSATLTYTSGMNVRDSANAVLTGSRLTEYTFKVTNGIGSLVLRIYGPLGIVVERTLTE